MPRALPYAEAGVTTGYMVFCPACNCGHLFNTAPGPNGAGGKKPVWTFVNGDVDRPTFVASMLVKTNDPTHPHYQPQAKSSVCHSHVWDGKIQFLADCTHQLAGQTVDLPDWDDMRPATTPGGE